jgi:hypothetical protein
MNELVEDTIKWWQELDPADREFYEKSLTYSVAHFIAYKFYRRVLGAPKWAAYGIPAINITIHLAPLKRAYELRHKKK